MVNKNDISDLKKFFLAAGAIILAIIVFFAVLSFLTLKKYSREINIINAKISDYIQSQWEKGESKKTDLRPAQ